MLKYSFALLIFVCSLAIFAQEKKKTDCSDCKGSEKVKCIICNGEGKIFYKCYECDGKGVVECSQCEGKGQLQCNNCSGTGKTQIGFKCKICKGKGKVGCVYCQHGKYKCLLCGGEKKIGFICGVCKRNKTVRCLKCYTPDKKCFICADKIEIKCPQCDGKGKIKEIVFCDECQGRGFTICPDCSGLGSIVCNACQGSGKFPRYDSKGNLKLESSPKCDVCKGDAKSKCTKCKGRKILRCKKCNGARFFESDCLTCNGNTTINCVWHEKNNFISIQSDELKLKFTIIPLEFIDPTRANTFYALCGNKNFRLFFVLVSNDREEPINFGNEIKLMGNTEDGFISQHQNEYVGKNLKGKLATFVGSLIDSKFPIKIPAKSSDSAILAYYKLKSGEEFEVQDNYKPYKVENKKEILTLQLLKKFQEAVSEKNK